jgi:hypothetical protein
MRRSKSLSRTAGEGPLVQRAGGEDVGGREPLIHRALTQNICRDRRPAIIAVNFAKIIGYD